MMLIGFATAKHQHSCNTCDGGEGSDMPREEQEAIKALQMMVWCVCQVMIPLLCCCICTATYGCGSVKLYKKVKRDRFQDQMVKDFESALDQKVSAVRGSQ